MQDPDSCMLLAQLDQHCLGQICAKLDPKHLALFGATCKPINTAATQSMAQLKARWSAWLDQFGLAGSPPACYHYKDDTMEDKLMRFALGDTSGTAAKRSLALYTNGQLARRWLRRRCAALGLVVEIEDVGGCGCNCNMNVTLHRPQGWQMPWDADPVPWTPACDDCGAQLSGQYKKRFHLCENCYHMYCYQQRQMEKMHREEEMEEEGYFDDEWDDDEGFDW